MNSDETSSPNDDRHPEGCITVERRGHVLLMGLDRMEKLNSFTPKMHGELQSAFVELDENPELRVGIVFGHGKHFTAGLDLPKFMAWLAEGRSPIDPDKVDPWSRGKRCSKPVITAVKGISYTAGLELMLAGDIVIAADDCRFSQMEPKRGIMATGGGVMRFIERGGWGNAMYHLLTCDEFGSAEALRIGLVQDVVPAGQELDRAIEVADQIAANAPLAVQATKANGLVFVQQGEQTAIVDMRARQTVLVETDDSRKGVRSFVERRPAAFTGQ